MHCQIHLPIQQQTYQEIHQLTQRLNAGEKQHLSKALGDALTNLSCEVLDQAFAVLVRQQYADLNITPTYETQKVLAQIEQHLHKYMPWSLALLSNERLLPMANYICEQFICHDPQQIYLSYQIDATLAKNMHQHFEAVLAGDSKDMQKVFRDLIEVIDMGVTTLIRKPKAMLNFNLVVDKTLNGVIHMVTTLGYKRMERLAQQLPFSQVQDCVKHFNHFLY